MAGIYIRRIRLSLAVFIVGLTLSGITAIPLETELRCLARLAIANKDSSVTQWVVKVRDGLVETNAKYPFIAYQPVEIIAKKRRIVSPNKLDKLIYCRV